MNELVFVLSVYLIRPLLDVPTAIALSYALMTAFSKALGPGATEALREVQARCDALETGWKQQQSQTVLDARSERLALINAWSAAVTRVEQYTRLPPDRHDAQPVAVQIYALLAPDGLSVTRAQNLTLWSTIKTRLDLLREQGLLDDLRRIAGPEFVDEVTHCYGELGRALSVTAIVEAPTPANLLELLRAHAQAVTDYVVQVAATVRRDKPETVLAAINALKPIVDVRDQVARRASPAQPAPDPVVVPTQPAPVVQAVQSAQLTQPAQTVASKTVAPSRPSLPPPIN